MIYATIDTTIYTKSIAPNLRRRLMILPSVSTHPKNVFYKTNHM